MKEYDDDEYCIRILKDKHSTPEEKEKSYRAIYNRYSCNYYNFFLIHSPYTARNDKESFALKSTEELFSRLRRSIKYYNEKKGVFHEYFFVQANNLLHLKLIIIMRTKHDAYLIENASRRLKECYLSYILVIKKDSAGKCGGGRITEYNLIEEKFRYLVKEQVQVLYFLMGKSKADVLALDDYELDTFVRDFIEYTWFKAMCNKWIYSIRFDYEEFDIKTFIRKKTDQFCTDKLRRIDVIIFKKALISFLFFHNNELVDEYERLVDRDDFRKVFYRKKKSGDLTYRYLYGAVQMVKGLEITEKKQHRIINELVLRKRDSKRTSWRL